MGKGMGPKKGYNDKLYGDNYDGIFCKRKKVKDLSTDSKESKKEYCNKRNYRHGLGLMRHLSTGKPERRQ